jgi:protocatechuate 3,4-dioxygenase beta subunit
MLLHPHIHFIIEHPKLTPLASKFYFFDRKKSFIVDTDEEDKVFFIKNKSIINQVSAVPSNKTGDYTIDITMSDEIVGKGF